MVQAPIGYRLRSARKDKKLTQASVAKQAGISASYLNLIEANKREIGGALLNRIAGILGINTDELTGRTERRMIADLAEASAEPPVRHLDLSPSEAAEFVGRHPGWAQAMLTFHRAWREQSGISNALADRLNQDPVLGESVHQLLTHATAIQSSSEILDELPQEAVAQRTRFREIVSVESHRLSAAAEVLRGLFDQSGTAPQPLTPADEIDDFLIQHDIWFPSLELAGEKIRNQLRGMGGVDEGNLQKLAEKQLGLSVSRKPLGDDIGRRYRNQMVFDGEENQIVFLSSASSATRRFQLARHIAASLAQQDIESVLVDPLLTSDAARERGRHVLASYVAGAILFPYAAFLQRSEENRYDIARLCQTFDASFEQICHRLVTLRDPENHGIPFAFLRSDPAGQITKRFPLPRLSLFRHGHACPLWVSFSAFQTPGRLVRQLGEFPDGARYLMIAQAVPRAPAAYHEAPFIHSIMLICDMIHADRTVYAEGWPPAMATAQNPQATPVGPGCRMCARTDCRFRGEETILEGHVA